MKTLADIGEDALVARIRELVTAPPHGGIGDDCAVTPAANGSRLLKVDSIIAGKHFLPDEAPERVGRKAINRVVSDLAAMGGQLTEVLVAMALPPETEITWVEQLYRGLDAATRAQGAYIVGGETSGLDAGSAAVISITGIGEMPAQQAAIFRSGGQPGDVLAVTGELGDTFHTGHHLDFEPRLAAGQWLASRPEVTAMMDLSDGLAHDSSRLAKESSCGVAIDVTNLPRRNDCSTQAALHDGEDYELLVATSDFDSLKNAWSKAFPELPLTAVGQLNHGPLSDGSSDGFRHF